MDNKGRIFSDSAVQAPQLAEAAGGPAFTSDLPDGVVAEKALFRKLRSTRPAHVCSVLAAAAPERQ